MVSRFKVATARFSCTPPDLNFLDPYFIFMYMHYNHCHRATAHFQLNILLLFFLLLPISNKSSPAHATMSYGGAAGRIIYIGPRNFNPDNRWRCGVITDREKAPVSKSNGDRWAPDPNWKFWRRKILLSLQRFITDCQNRKRTTLGPSPAP